MPPADLWRRAVRRGHGASLRPRLAMCWTTTTTQRKSGYILLSLYYRSVQYCVVTQSGSRSSAKPLLQQLHWLPVTERITYKQVLLAYKVHTATAPDYLCCLLQPRHNNRPLRSSLAPHFVVPYTQTEIGKRGFLVFAATVWNSLPSKVWSSDSLSNFEPRHKTTLINSVLIAILTSYTSLIIKRP